MPHILLHLDGHRPLRKFTTLVTAAHPAQNSRQSNNPERTSANHPTAQNRSLQHIQSAHLQANNGRSHDPLRPRHPSQIPHRLHRPGPPIPLGHCQPGQPCRRFPRHCGQQAHRLGQLDAPADGRCPIRVSQSSRLFGRSIRQVA